MKKKSLPEAKVNIEVVGFNSAHPKGALRVAFECETLDAWGLPDRSRFTVKHNVKHPTHKDVVGFTIMKSQVDTGGFVPRLSVSHHKGIGTVRRDRPTSRYYRFYIPEPGGTTKFRPLRYHSDTAVMVGEGQVFIPYPPNFELRLPLMEYEGL